MCGAGDEIDFAPLTTYARMCAQCPCMRYEGTKNKRGKKMVIRLLLLLHISLFYDGFVLLAAATNRNRTESKI